MECWPSRYSRSAAVNASRFQQSDHRVHLPCAHYINSPRCWRTPATGAERCRLVRTAYGSMLRHSWRSLQLLQSGRDRCGLSCHQSKPISKDIFLTGVKGIATTPSMFDGDDYLSCLAYGSCAELVKPGDPSPSRNDTSSPQICIFSSLHWATPEQSHTLMLKSTRVRKDLGRHWPCLFAQVSNISVTVST
jgi:hypothetical protein